MCLYRISDYAWSSYVRCRYDYGRWSVEEDPDKICCAGEANKGREAHQNIKELLDLVYLAHDAFRIRLFSYGHVDTLRRDSRGPAVDTETSELSREKAAKSVRIHSGGFQRSIPLVSEFVLSSLTFRTLF